MTRPNLPVSVYLALDTHLILNRMGDMKRLELLGWDAPVVDKVRDYLLTLVHTGNGGSTQGAGQALDLEGILIVVPTRQAGRHLRESMALWCEVNGTALLSARIVTPNYLFMQGINEAEVAGSVLTRAAWVRVLTGNDLSLLSSLFPGVNSERSFQWAMNTGDIMQNLRRELADGAYSIRSVLQQHAGELEELERWQDMAALEELYLAELKKAGKTDSCIAEIDAAMQIDLNPKIKRIVVACVPDPSLLSIEALKSADRDGMEIDILVHADPELDGTFDEWGRPKPEHWRSVNIDIPDWKNDVCLESTPAAQAKRVCLEIVKHSEQFESGEMAIGVPDRSVIPFIEKTLGAESLSTFDPADAMVGEHPVGLLGAGIADLVQYCSYDAVANLLRHPDFLVHLKDEYSLESLEVLGQLDGFQNYYLPVTFDAMLLPFKNNPSGACDQRDDFTELGKALRVIESILKLFETHGFEEAWRTVYQQIYKSRKLDLSRSRDVEFESAAMAVDAVLREFRELSAIIKDLDIVKLSSLFAARLGEATYHRERHDEIIDLEGWLELPWNSRPFLMVTGMNEQFVPGGSLSDAFLPDSLRSILDLRDDSARFARDIFLMQGMIKSRGDGGRAFFIVGKTATSGDPLKPSRLLFRCDDAELPARVEKLLAGIRDNSSQPYADVIFTLEPGRADAADMVLDDKYISVTSFRDYLECPFRYYLRRVLGMEAVSDDKAGLDHMDFGNIVHEVLQVMGEDKDLWACSDDDELGEKLADIASSLMAKRFGTPTPLSVEISLMAAQERLRAAARAQTALVKSGWAIKDVETGAGRKGAEKNRWRLKRGGFTISGRIDRIDENLKDGRIRIIDYKTFDNFKTPESEHLAGRTERTPEYNDAFVSVVSRGKLKQEHMRWTDLQLPLYEMIYNQGIEYNEKIELAYFGLPKATSQTGIIPWDTFDRGRMESAVECLDAVLDRIDKKVFWPPSESTRYDDDYAAMFYFENSVNPMEKAVQ